MKSTAPTAIALTLLMIVLVLGAAVFFLFQGQQTLNNELQGKSSAISTSEKQLADEELSSAMARSTYDVLEASSTAMASENTRLSSELAESSQLNLTRNAEEAQLTLAQKDAEATIESFETRGPLIALVSPDENQELFVGQEIELVIVASDYLGLTAINFTIGGGADLQGANVEEGKFITFVRHPWNPDFEGNVDIKITATNKEGIQSEEIFSRNVKMAPPNTPEPTIEITIQATATSETQ